MDDLVRTGTLQVTPAREADGTRVLRVRGAVDRTVTGPWAEALHAGAETGGDIHLDMSGLVFIDVGGLRVLVEAAARLDGGRRYRVRNLAPPMHRVVRLTGWDRAAGLVIDRWSGEAGRPVPM
ncbi:STAS domain-containing protein [Spirillospora albida]|uniref:STAS domain-containing protein n=1 Tax=Spirillospora albida TaxID=58123 RepID=UPI0006915D51|nr:STAS domain-containing protein [Spirillospora albida]